MEGGAAVADTDRAFFDMIVLRRVTNGVFRNFVLYGVWAVQINSKLVI